MHKWAKQIMECVKAKVDGIGIENFEGQNLDDLKDFTEIAKNIACFDKDYRIVEAMEKSEDNDDIMRMLEQYEDYPDRRYYDAYRYANGRFAPKGRGTYSRGYEEPPYYHMTPEMYHRDMDRDMGRIYYTETSSSGMRDAREGRSGMSRRTYMENKELHKANTQQDKEAKVRDLNTYMTELANDMTEIINDATPEEKTVLRNKLSALVTKIG